jgi:4-amino-4-deoxy-L-arabinose transferase-like glycosyltransferase
MRLFVCRIATIATVVLLPAVATAVTIAVMRLASIATFSVIAESIRSVKLKIYTKGLSFLRGRLPLLTVAAAIAALYLYDLNGVGLLGPDEPRYAAIGRAMAQTGQYITPKLWGAPWFEKPPLLYWMTAAATACDLGRELSARLPVALLSLAFLAVAYVLLRREFGPRAAAASTALLATSAGWLTYSGLCLTDLPLAAFFSLAVLASLPLLREPPDMRRTGWRFAAIGACLGLAALAKGLVPIALAVPFLWFLRRYWRQCWAAVSAFLVVVLPWYLAVYLQNGNGFLEQFFWKQHIERIYSPVLQHVQPWYYYFPILLLGLFPWTPLAALLVRRGTPWDARRRFLAAIVWFGFLLFSVALNKLPGYLLPLLPSAFVLIGAQFEHKMVCQTSRWLLLPCALLIGAVPLLAPLLPPSLAAGRFSLAPIGKLTATEMFYVCVPVAVVFLSRRVRVGALLVLCVVAAGIYLKAATFPVLDRDVSARGLWRRAANVSGAVCEDGISRDWIYGLSFYRGALVPHCGTGRFTSALLPAAHRPPMLVPVKR